MREKEESGHRRGGRGSGAEEKAPVHTSFDAGRPSTTHDREGLRIWLIVCYHESTSPSAVGVGCS